MAAINLTLSPLARRRVAQALLALAALMAVDVLYQIGVHLTWRHWVSKQTRAIQTTAPPATQPAGKDKPSRPPELAAALRKRNIFIAPRPTGHGLTLTGVIGNLALFASRDRGSVAIKEGESGNGVNVKSIDGYDVVIEFEGKKETLHLFNPDGSSPPMPQGRGVAMSGEGERVMVAPRGAPGGSPSRVHMESAPGPTPDLSNMPPEVREQIERQMRRRQK